MSSVDELVDGLDKVFMQLLYLLLLLRPFVCSCFGVDTMNVLVVFDESLNRVRC